MSFACSHFAGDYNNWQWTAGLLVGSLFLVRGLEDWIAVSALYFIANGLFTVLSNIRSNANILLILTPAMATMCFVGAVATGLLFRRVHREALGGFGIINALLVIVQFFLGFEFYEGRQSGFIDYASLNGCLLALSLPVLIERCDRERSRMSLLAIFLVGVAISLSRSNIPYAVTGIVVTTQFWLMRWRLVALLSFPAVAIAGIFSGVHSASGLQRLEAYKTFIGYWWGHFNTVYGAGAGTFRFLSHDIQVKTGFGLRGVGENINLEYWPWMHSDWLQVLFEYGTVGLALTLAVFFIGLWQLHQKKDHPTFSMLVGLGATAVFNYPLRYFVFGVLGTMALARANNEERA